MAQPDWLLSWLLCSVPLEPPAHRKQSASPVNSQQKRKRKLILKFDIRLTNRLVGKVHHLISERDEFDFYLQFTQDQLRS